MCVSIAAAGGIASDIFERFQALFRLDTVNNGDIALGIVAAQIGGGLKTGAISMNDVGARIRSTLCQH